LPTHASSSGSDAPVPDRLKRFEILLGAEGVESLSRATIAVVGLGGVGSWAAEALARSGVGTVILVDGDKYCATDLNRQLFCTTETLGLPKVTAAERRLHLIAPGIRVKAVEAFLDESNIKLVLSLRPTVVVDAIDRLDGKIPLLAGCVKAGIAVVSSMGAGGRIDPTRIETADVFSSAGCPLARTVRRSLKAIGITQGITAVFSREEPVAPLQSGQGKAIQGSAVWVTAAFGLAAAGAAITLALADLGPRSSENTA